MATAFSLDKFISAPPLKRAEAVAKGLPAKAIRDLVADRAVSLADVARVVGPRRTLDRRLKENKRLSPEESDRLARFAATLDLATQIFGSRAAAMDWLTTPKRRFDDEAPLNLLKSDAGTRVVEEILEQGRHGFTA
jgi:putative toxin-antitoxin system antitoxin component (TIGR02293 family)